MRPDIVESTAMRDGVLGSPDWPSDENSENEDKDVDEDGEWSIGAVTLARRTPSTRRRKKCPSVNVCTTKHTLIRPGSNTELRCEA